MWKLYSVRIMKIIKWSTNKIHKHMKIYLYIVVNTLIFCFPEHIYLQNQKHLNSHKYLFQFIDYQKLK